MTAPYRIDSANRMIVVTWPSAEPSISIVSSTVEAILAEPARPRRFRLLAEWRQALEPPALPFVNDFLRSLHRWRAAGLERWATVVRPDALAAYGTGRMMEVRAESNGDAYRVFRDHDEAVRWLLSDGNAKGHG